MTAAAQDIDTQKRDGVLLDQPVKTAQKIYGGTMVCVDATGYAVPGADTAGLIFQGVADNHADNTGGQNGDKTVTVRRRGLYRMTLATAITIANVGDNVFLADDNNVDLAANVDNNIFCGVIAGYIDTTHAWIDIEPAIRQADVATHIADASGAHAASAISLADTGGFTAKTEVEAALAELYPRVTAPAAIADPGDGKAIPVTRSGVCAMTSAGAETRTLADPTFIGQEISLIDDTHVGNIVVTAASPINQTGNNTITFGAAADAIVLKAMSVGGDLVWREVANDGAALSTVG